MKPALGDVLINRYTLVYRLRDEPGIQAWRANDRVLARDCQLFIVNDANSVDDVISIASSLALSKSKQFTQVLHLQQWGKLALIVTQLDAGVCLSDYLHEPVDASPLDFDAMASIIAECALAMHQRSSNEFTHRAVSTDVIRLTMNGIQLADAPVSPVLADISHSPKGLGVTGRITRQLAVVLYEMLTRTPRSRPKDRSWNSLPADTPQQLRRICERGMTFTDHDISSSAPLTTTDELTALLGDIEALTALDSEHINLPREDAECSISVVPLRKVRPQDLLDFPNAATASAAMGALDSGNSAQRPGEGRPVSDLGSATTSTSMRDSDDTGTSYASGNDTSYKQHWDFHDFATSRMANMLPPEESITSDLIFADSSGSNIFDPNSIHNTVRIPVIDDSGTPLAPGEKSARAFEDGQDDRAQTGGATSPPSFIPHAESKVTPESHGFSTSAPSSHEDDDIADAPIFGSIRTKVVAIVIGTLVLAAGLVWALQVLLPDSSEGSTQNTQNDWPQIDVSDVPFGDSPPPAEDDTATKQTPTQPQVEHSDKVVSAVPTPAVPDSNTPLTFDVRQMITEPAGHQGLSYYLHLSEPHTPYRIVVQNRTSGGTAYVLVNTTGDPNQGEQVAEFSFDPSGTTEVKFDRLVDTQDLVIWMPYDTMPQGGIYFSAIQVF